MEKEKGGRFTYAISLLLLGAAIISMIGAWQNRRYFFDDYIYDGNLFEPLDSYSEDLRRYLGEEMTGAEENYFLSQNGGVYYNVTYKDSDFSNLPEEVSTSEFSARDGIITLTLPEEAYYITAYSNLFEIWEIEMATVTVATETDSEMDSNRMSGYVFLDTDIGPMLASSFQDEITWGLLQQKMLYIDCAVAVVGLLAGGALMILSVKRRALELADSLPLDVAVAAPASLLFIWNLVYGTYSSNLNSAVLLGQRYLITVLLAMLTAVLIFFIICLIRKAFSYHRDNSAIFREWDNRLTRNIPAWLVGLVVQVLWYFVSLSAFTGKLTLTTYYYFLSENISTIISHILIIIGAFLLLSRLWKASSDYAKEVISSTMEIADGNFEQEAKVVGRSNYAQLAEAVNSIRDGYALSLEEQRRSERLKYELVTNISHDLRTPLTSMINYIGLLQRESISGEGEHYLDLADANAQKLNLMIEDLFDLSKIESGSVELKLAEVDLCLLLKQVCYEHEGRAQQQGLEIVQDYPEGEHKLQCDSLKLSRAFDNIICNAVKYSLTGTRIYVNVKEYNNCYEVSVKNIASYKMDFEPQELFLRFKRADKARSSEGSGLGLAIAKGMVELHGGSIRIETEGDMFKVIVEL